MPIEVPCGLAKVEITWIESTLYRVDSIQTNPHGWVLCLDYSGRSLEHISGYFSKFEVPRGVGSSKLVRSTRLIELSSPELP